MAGTRSSLRKETEEGVQVSGGEGAGRAAQEMLRSRKKAAGQAAAAG